jgi:hypothetical protein
MAGKLLPLALATVSGISIGIATFGPELKEQRKKKLTDDYNRYVYTNMYLTALHLHTPSDVAAAAALNTEGLPPIVPTAIQTPADEDQGNPTTSSWSSMLGLWAWKKNPKHDATPAALAAPAVAQEAPAKTTIQRTDERA